MSKRIVIVGAGMAGVKLAQELCALKTDAQITLISAEARAGYNRIMLSPVLSGEKHIDEIGLTAPDWFKDSGVELVTGCEITQINTNTKVVSNECGDQYNYDTLVLATGSSAFKIPFKGIEGEGVYVFRTFDDVCAMLSRLKAASLSAPDKKGRAVVIGGGLLGLEAAAALNRQGAKVTVIHNAEHLMNTQLNAAAASLLQDHFESNGIEFILGAKTKEILLKDNQVSGVAFEDRGDIEADLVVMAVGVRPNLALAQSLADQSDLQVERGIVVDAQLKTNLPEVYALGECVQFEGQTFGLVAPVYDQAKILARRLCGLEGHFAIKPLATKLKVTGVDLFSGGDIRDLDHYTYATAQNPITGTYKRLSFDGDRLVGAILYGDVADGSWLFDLIENQTDISELRDRMIFGQHYTRAA